MTPQRWIVLGFLLQASAATRIASSHLTAVG
jgi:hypothetical protein